MGDGIEPVSKSGILLEYENGKVMISGHLSCLDPGPIMNPFFKKISDHALKKNVKHLDVDIRKLTGMNSGGMREFIDWITEISKLPKDQRYTMKFICNKNILWQDASIRALSYLDDKIVKIEFI